MQWSAADAGGGSRTVTLTSEDPSATIKYQVNGGSLTTYTGPITVSAFDRVDAYAERVGYSNSELTRLEAP